jgi:hypothetical protein
MANAKTCSRIVQLLWPASRHSVMSRQKEKGRRHVSMTTASESFGQPVDL